jgi:sensor histidine kinase regulating citrate/malate metabolism
MAMKIKGKSEFGGRERVSGDSTGADETLSEEEIARQAADLSKRLMQTCDSVVEKRHPFTASDAATVQETITLLNAIAGQYGEQSGEVAESIRRRQRLAGLRGQAGAMQHYLESTRRRR